MIPLLFGIQQLIEGVVWLTFSNHPLLHGQASYIYALFSHVLWPFFVPLAVLMIEPNPRRKKILAGFLLFGISVSLQLLVFVMKGPITSSVVENCIAYQVPTPNSPLLLVMYLFATCASCLCSSHRFIKIFGVALFSSLLIALWAYRFAFYSVWCFFAAILSLIIYFHLRQDERGL